MDRLLRVAPFDLYYGADRLRLLYLAGHRDRALDEFNRLRQLDPNFVDLEVADTYDMLGRVEDGYRTRIAFLEQCGTSCDSMRGYAARVGRRWSGGSNARLTVAFAVSRGTSPGFPLPRGSLQCLHYRT